MTCNVMADRTRCIRSDVNFVNPGARVPVQGRGHIGHKVKMHYLF